MFQDPKESLRVFVSRFGTKALNIPNIDIATATEGFKLGLKDDSPFFEDLVMTPHKRMDEVRIRALRFIGLEEDKEIQKRASMPSSFGNPNRKAKYSAQSSYNSKPYSQPDHRRFNALDDEWEDDGFPNIIDYCFYVDVLGLIFVI